MSVERCVCFDVPFTLIARLAREGRTLERIRAETGCSGGCGMCKPYIDVVIATGRTVLPVLSESVCRAIVENAQGSSWARADGSLAMGDGDQGSGAVPPTSPASRAPIPPFQPPGAVR